MKVILQTLVFTKLPKQLEKVHAGSFLSKQVSIAKVLVGKNMDKMVAIKEADLEKMDDTSLTYLLVSI